MKRKGGGREYTYVICSVNSLWALLMRKDVFVLWSVVLAFEARLNTER